MSDARTEVFVRDRAQGEVDHGLLLLVVTGLFFLSGAAGLVYQVLWMRRLGLLLGSDMYGVAIILSTFMGGLALGSLAGGHLAERSARPLLWYGLAELGIGIFALGFGSLVGSFDPILGRLYALSPEGGGGLYQVGRVILSSGSLLVPTTLMGATLPLVMRQFVRTTNVLGGRAAYFYAVNTLGAMVGTLLAGFFLLPRLGMSASTVCAAVVNLSIGVSCVIAGWRVPIPVSVRSVTDRYDPSLDPLPGLRPEIRRRIARAAIVAIGISGFGSFALEVVWTRILLTTFSATVYSFTSMLVCFLFGIFLGSVLVSRVVDRHRDPAWLFAQLELGLGVSIGLLCLVVVGVPELFAGILGRFAALTGGKGDALVFATLLASFLLLVVPATLLGATFSVALRAYTTNVGRVGSRTGNLYFANTLGAIVGSLFAAMILLPVAGAKASLALIALLFASVGIYLAVLRVPGGDRARGRLGIAIAATLTVTAAGGSLLIPYRVTLNLNQRARAETELLYHAEGIQNTIDVTRSRSGVTSLIIGGNVEADDGYTQLRHFILKGHLPLLFAEQPRSVLVIGLGMGITLAATARHEGVEEVQVVELSPEILRAQEKLRSINDDVARNPRVRVRIDDGRNFLKMTDRRYDMITADPIHPKISRVGYLYTREYYESIRDHLREGGVVCQWMPIYQIAPRRLRSAMKTFLEVFPNATFWYVKNHGLFVAKRGSARIDYRHLARRFRLLSVKKDLASIGIGSPESLLAHLLLGPEQIRSYVDAEGEIPLNTDDYPYLEYFVPGDLFYRPIANVRELVADLVDPTTLVEGQPPASVAEVRALSEGRAQRLIAELE